MSVPAGMETKKWLDSSYEVLWVELSLLWDLSVMALLTLEGSAGLLVGFVVQLFDLLSMQVYSSFRSVPLNFEIKSCTVNEIKYRKRSRSYVCIHPHTHTETHMHNWHRTKPSWFYLKHLFISILMKSINCIKHIAFNLLPSFNLFSTVFQKCSANCNFYNIFITLVVLLLEYWKQQQSISRLTVSLVIQWAA